MPAVDAVNQVMAQATALGIPASLVLPLLQAIDSAGYNLVPNDAPTAPVPLLGPLRGERRSVVGMPGVYVCGAQLEDRGWLVWMEVLQGDGTIARGAAVFSAEPGSLVKRAPTSGEWTVGLSTVEGPHTISGGGYSGA